MKKRVLTVVTAALLLLSIPAVLLGWGFLLPPQYGDTFLGELKYKVQYLEEAQGPRIVLVGGSGVAFGVDSALMERELPGYTVVNFGMYAALGTTVMLDLSEDLIHPGDIVILIPEQQEQTLSDFFDPAVMWQALDGAFPLLGRLPGTYRSALAGQFPYFAAQKYADLLQGRTPRPRGVYSRASFNAAGDVVSGLCSRNIMSGGYDPNTPIRFDSALATDAFLSRVNAYARSVEERGATMWYAFCPMNAAAVVGDAGPDEFYDALQAALRFPVIGDPNQSILESGWFYDTNFHLNASGKIVYTRLLVRNIKAVLGDSSPTEIALPRQPAPTGADTWSGDDHDADCFLYREADGLLTVVGLSAGSADRPLGVERPPRHRYRRRGLCRRGPSARGSRSAEYHPDRRRSLLRLPRPGSDSHTDRLPRRVPGRAGPPGGDRCGGLCARGCPIRLPDRLFLVRLGAEGSAGRTLKRG